jgi:hypothetical protein
MKTALSFAALALSLIIAGPASAQSPCRFRDMGRANIVQNQDGAWMILLEQGQQSCQGTFGAGSGARATASDFQMTSVSVARPPRAGSVRTSSNGFTYTGQPGDSFVLRLCGKSRAGQGCANVTYNVSR